MNYSRIFIENFKTGDYYLCNPQPSALRVSRIAPLDAVVSNGSARGPVTDPNYATDFRLFMMLSDLLTTAYITMPRACGVDPDPGTRDLADPAYRRPQTATMRRSFYHPEGANGMMKDPAALRVHWVVRSSSVERWFVSDNSSYINTDWLNGCPHGGIEDAINFAYSHVSNVDYEMGDNTRSFKFLSDSIRSEYFGGHASDKLNNSSLRKVKNLLANEGYSTAFVFCGSVTVPSKGATSKDRAKTWHLFRARKPRAKHSLFFMGWSPSGDQQSCFVNLTPISTQTFHDSGWAQELVDSDGKLKAKVKTKAKAADIPAWNNTLADSEPALDGSSPLPQPLEI